MFGRFRVMQNSASALTRAMAYQMAPRRFMQREDGTVTAFAAMLFVLMVAASGIAIDVMRYETQRTQLQYTLDRAVLAAASLTQPYDPEGVVRDYFSIAGIEDYRLDVRVDEGLNFRRVHAYAELEVRSLFMQMFGVRVMTSPAIGAAEERVRRIEVSMVLDISGSMGSNSRLTNMRPAARDFVSEVLNANTNVNNELLVSVSIVPYNGRVNGGSLIDRGFAFDGLHNQSNCARFHPSAYLTTGIDPTAPIQRLAHWDRNREHSDRLFSSPHCQTDEYGAILPWEHRENILHNHINSLNAGGWTAIDVGVNWGVALLDPLAEIAVDRLIASGNVHPEFGDRPAPYRDANPTTTLDDETIKVVVMMTDGDNTNQYDLRDIWMTVDNRIIDTPESGASIPPEEDAIYMGFREGYSQVFLHYGPNRNWAGDDRYSVWWEPQNRFWIPTGDPRNAGGYWSMEPFGGWAAYGMIDPADGDVVDDWDTHRMNAFDPDLNDDGIPDDLDGTVLSWSFMWSNYTARYIAEEWYEEAARANGDWRLDQAVRSPSFLSANGAQADINLRAICDAANATGIVVFAIGFEAPQRGQDVMRHCASSDAHYYDVDGIEISEAFASIARTINQLRLIQ